MYFFVRAAATTALYIGRGESCKGKNLGLSKRLTESERERERRERVCTSEREKPEGG
jgi:hypothetical protein